MGLNANTAGPARAQQPVLKPKQYPARVVAIVDLGLQPQKPFKGVPKPNINKMRLTYELSSQFMPDEDGNDDLTKPMWMSETIPLHNIATKNATSTLRMQAIDADGVTGNDFIQLAGMPCQVGVVNNEKDGTTYNNIGAVGGPIDVEGYVQPELVNPVQVFVLDAPDMEQFNAFPGWLQDEIKANLEYSGSPLQKALGEETVLIKSDEAPAKPSAPKAPAAPAQPAEASEQSCMPD